MHEFETFVYLDMEKTGSGFISTLLRRFCSEREIRRDHHGRLDADFDSSKFYFISVRHPFDAYISLYSFGCQERGKLRASLERAGLKDCYGRTTDGFKTWLRFVLRPENAHTMGDGYGRPEIIPLCRIVGLQTYRYLQLAIPDADAVLSQCRTRDDVRAVHAERKLPAFTVRYESFADDLERLLRGPIRHAVSDVDGAVNFVRTAKPVNASKRVDKVQEDFAVKDRLLRRLKDREWFLYELFGY